MRVSRRDGCPPRSRSPQTIEQIEKALAAPLADDPVVAAVQFPEGVDADAVRAALRDAVEQSLRPGLEAYRYALRDALRHARVGGGVRAVLAARGRGRLRRGVALLHDHGEDRAGDP